MTDLLDSYLGGESQPVRDDDPLDGYFQQQREARLAVQLRHTENPDQVARANVLSRKAGVPASVVQSNLPVFEQQEKANRANDIARQHPAIGKWSADPRNAAAAADDYDVLGRMGAALKKRVVRDTTDFITGSGFMDRMGDLLGRAGYALESGAATVRGALQDWSANNALPWTSEQNRRKEQASAVTSRAMARITNRAASTEIAGETTFDALREQRTPAALGRFVLDQGVGSLPGMAVAGLALPLYIVGQAGSIGQNRAENNGRQDADITDVARAAPAAVASGILERLGIEAIFGAPAKNALLRIGQAAAGEGATEFIQSGVEYAGGSVGTEKGFSGREALNQSIAGMIAGAGTGGSLRGTGEALSAVARPVGRMVQTLRKADAAATDAAILDQLGHAAAQSKLKQRDPEAFAALIKAMAEETGSDQVYIPAEAVQQYMQSDGYSGDFDAYREQVDEAYATGGDVVLPIETVVTSFAATPAWDAIKDDMRLTAGGMSRKEAQTFDDAMADVMAELSDKMAGEQASAAEMAVPRERLFQTITDKLMDAGFTPTTARTQAELLAQRYATRSARLGRELTGDEFSDVLVNSVLPERLAVAQKADQLDMTINVMRRGLDAKTGQGQSLLEFVSAHGGLEDRGGDLKAMGADRWHVGKPGKRKLLRGFNPNQETMLGIDGAQANNGLDFMAMRAWQAGYFPDHVERPTINEFLEAIDGELRGNARYSQAQDKTLRDAADELRALLESRGIDADTASPKEIRAAVDRYVSEQASGLGYDQSFADGPRGRITFPAAGFSTGPSVIDLFQSRDLSTFLHETGHLWLEELRFDASDPDAPDQLKADWQAVQDWFAVNGHAIENGVIPVDAHEMWARGVERYLMEGKAPSEGLRKMFETFKGWLVNIYRTLGRLNAPVTDDIRGVMDRLIATDEEIAAAQEQQNIEALFKDAAQAGMSDAEFQAYVDTTTQARDSAHDALLRKAMGAVRARVTKEYREQEANVRTEVQARVDERPEFRALRLLKATPIDSQWIRDTYGDDTPSMLPKQVPPVHKTGGVHPDEVAEMSGFKSGDEMVRTLMGVETRRRELREGGDQRSVRKALIDQETDAIMKERYGDPFTDGSIEEEALALVHNDQQGEVIAAEMRVLARRTGQRPTPYSIAKEWAARTVREGTVNSVASRSAIQRYQRAASKAGKSAMDAILAGDTVEAFRHKQAQQLNNALISEAKKAADEVDVAVARLDKWSRRKTIKSVDQDYLERAQALLEQVDMRPRSQRSIERQANFEEWAKEQEAAGHDLVVPASFAVTLGTTHWSRLSVEQLLGLDDAVKQIIHLGRLKQTLIDNKERRDFEEVRDEALAAHQQLPPKPPKPNIDPGWIRRGGDAIKSAHSALIKIETVVDMLDSGNPNGVHNRVIFRPLADAQARENDMIAEKIGAVQDNLASVPKDVLKRWDDKITVPEMPNNGDPVWTRGQLIQMAKNWGNRSNINVMLEGYGWNEQAAFAALDRILTKEEWDYIQGEIDIINDLWPQIEEMERRINGIAPPKVEALPIVTRHGTYNGGYYPLVADSTQNPEIERRKGKSEDLFESLYTKANTRHGFTNERTGATYKLSFSQGITARHITEVIHDLTHRELVMSVDQFLNDPQIVRSMRERIGPELQGQFRPWLKHIANQWAQDRAGMEGIDRIVRKLRANMTIMGMGFRLSTILTQTAGYANSIEALGKGGEKWFGIGAKTAALDPAGSYKFVIERSGEIRHRMEQVDRDMRDALLRLQGKSGIVANAKKFAYHGIGYMDRVVVVPTWLAAYEKGLAEGMSEQDAAYLGDKVVRQSQGAGAAKDLAAVQRGTEFAKLAVMFYSYASAFYNRQATLARDIGGAVRGGDTKDFPRLLARAMWLVVAPNVVTGLIRVALGSGPDEDEDWASWFAWQLGAGLFMGVPLVRDAAASLSSGFDYQFTPIQQVFKTSINGVRDAWKAIDGDDETEPSKRAVRTGVEVVGYSTGLPLAGQIAPATQFIVAWANGDEDPETMGDWLEGLQKGRLED